MGILTDFIIGKENQEVELLEADSIRKSWQVLEFKNFDTEKLENLYQLIHGKLDFGLQPFEGCEDEGPWLFKLPQDLVITLSRINELGLEIISARWSATEELIADGWNQQIAQETLKQLSEFATKTKESNAVLYLLISV
jgi:hypothetical protein